VRDALDANNPASVSPNLVETVNSHAIRPAEQPRNQGIDVRHCRVSSSDFIRQPEPEHSLQRRELAGFRIAKYALRGRIY
jgi:hypothetical protein